MVLATLLQDFYRWPSVTSSFWALCALKVVKSGCNGVGTLVDVVTMSAIGSGEYGPQRLMNAIAWGVGSLCVASTLALRRHV